MTEAAVTLWGTRIGSVRTRGDGVEFFYDRDFAAHGIEICPLTMPLGTAVHRFPELPRRSFHGLPGLLADSLPDKFGNAVLNRWLARQGRTLDRLDPVERLLYVGRRGTGALEYAPALDVDEGDAPIEVPAIVELATEILRQRRDLTARLAADEGAMLQILHVSGSAGGARAKALVAWNRDTGEIRSGQAEAGDGFSHWLMKFDGVSGNRDRELDDPLGYGRIERAYADMVRDAGIEIADCELFEENGRAHFLTRRFDRDDDGSKRHMLSCAGLLHMDFNAPQQHSYEQVLDAMFALGLPLPQREQLLRRAVFNVLGRNQDDHAKNIAFLMDRSGHWRLSPAYDVTYAWNPAGQWTRRHQMTLAGKAEGFELADFDRLAAHAGVKRARSRDIVEQSVTVLDHWADYAQRFGVPDALIAQVANGLRVADGAPRLDRD